MRAINPQMAFGINRLRFGVFAASKYRSSKQGFAMISISGNQAVDIRTSGHQVKKILFLVFLIT
jgi:hypothetical protein